MDPLLILPDYNEKLKFPPNNWANFNSSTRKHTYEAPVCYGAKCSKSGCPKFCTKRGIYTTDCNKSGVWGSFSNESYFSIPLMDNWNNVILFKADSKFPGGFFLMSPGPDHKAKILNNDTSDPDTLLTAVRDDNFIPSSTDINKGYSYSADSNKDNIVYGKN